MRYIITAFFICLVFSGKAQTAFHVKVTCNPTNEGKINPAWLNNYVVEYTTDNWKHFHVINDQLTYQGYRDDGSTFYVSEYESISFKTIEDAIQYSQKFSSINRVGKYESMVYSKHLKLSEEYKKENSIHPINSKPPKELQCTEKIIY